METPCQGSRSYFFIVVGMSILSFRDKLAARPGNSNPFSYYSQNSPKQHSMSSSPILDQICHQLIMSSTDHVINQSWHQSCSIIFNSQQWLTNCAINLELRNIQGKICPLIQMRYAIFPLILTCYWWCYTCPSVRVQPPPTLISAITVISIPILSPLAIPSPTSLFTSYCWQGMIPGKLWHEPQL